MTPQRKLRSWDRLRSRQKVAVSVGGGLLVVIVACCGGLTTIGALSGEPRKTDTSAEGRQPAEDQPAEDQLSADEQPSTAAPLARELPSAPKVETRTVTAQVRIPFGQRTVKDPALAEGTKKIRTKGVAGVKILTYQVTLTDGVQTGKSLVREEVTRSPVTQVTAIGTKRAAAPQPRPQSRCDPNYSGACVPVASDVDCAGGSGNGPAYVTGPVRVVGRDIYDLDRDGDGLGCED